MSLNIKDLTFKSEPPRLPGSVTVYQTSDVHYESRKRSIEILAKMMDLGETTYVETPHSQVFGSRQGEIEYFSQSGAIWGSNTSVDSQFESEERKWDDVKESRDNDDIQYYAGRELSSNLVNQAQALLKESGLQDDREQEFVQKPEIRFDQYTQFDSRGRELTRGPGTASVHFGYQVDGIPVLGAGAKTLVLFEPLDRSPVISANLHAWRPIAKGKQVEIGSMESVLDAGLLHDPELDQYKDSASAIDIDSISFGYCALPVFIRQKFLFPAIQVEGTVHLRDSKLESFHFGRNFHILKPGVYSKLGFYADYLATAL